MIQRISLFFFCPTFFALFSIWLRYADDKQKFYEVYRCAIVRVCSRNVFGIAGTLHCCLLFCYPLSMYCNATPNTRLYSILLSVRFSMFLSGLFELFVVMCFMPCVLETYSLFFFLTFVNFNCRSNVRNEKKEPKTTTEIRGENKEMHCGCIEFL